MRTEGDILHTLAIFFPECCLSRIMIARVAWSSWFLQYRLFSRFCNYRQVEGWCLPRMSSSGKSSLLRCLVCCAGETVVCWKNIWFRFGTETLGALATWIALSPILYPTAVLSLFLYFFILKQKLFLSHVKFLHLAIFSLNKIVANDLFW